jgi:hypothetical protein
MDPNKFWHKWRGPIIGGTIVLTVMVFVLLLTYGIIYNGASCTDCGY